MGDITCQSYEKNKCIIKRGVPFIVLILREKYVQSMLKV